MKLDFSDNVKLPIEAATETFADLGKKRSGKTYGAQRRFELLHSAGVQCIALDGVGNWWALRLAANGKSAGLKDVYVFGGPRGDKPIDPAAGAFLARIVVEHGVSCVVDVSRFRKGERKRFVTDFAEEFFHLKKDAPSAVHLFLEEAHMFVPQRVLAGEERMLGAFEDIVRIGGNYGIGSTMISQRAASVNKDVLTQVECLIAYQTSSAQDKKAIREWLDENEEEGLALLSKLKGLHKGHALLWSPSWLRTFTEIHVTKKDTFDASATPKPGAPSAKHVRMPSLDLDKLEAAMAESVKSAAENDPKTLKRRIAELSTENARLTKEAALEREDLTDARVAQLEAQLEAAQRKAKVVEKPILKERDIKRLEAVTDRWFEMSERVNAQAVLIVNGLTAAKAPPPANNPTRTFVLPPPPPAVPVPRRNAVPQPPRPTNGEAPSACAVAIATAIAGLGKPVRRPQAAALAGYSISSSTFANAVTELTRGGYIGKYGDLIALTAEGQRLADLNGAGVVMRTPTELRALWRSKLSPSAGALFDVLASDGVIGNTVDRPVLSEASGYSLTSSTFANAITELNTLGLIVKDGSAIGLIEELI